MKVTFDISRNMIIRFLRKYLVFILLFGVVCGSGSVLYSLQTHGTKYSSESNLVQNDNNYNLVTSYQQFVSSRRFKSLMNTEISHSGWKSKSYRDNFSAALSYDSSDSPFFSIKITAVNKTYTEYLNKIATRLFMANIGKFLSGANVSVLSTASKANLVGFRSQLFKAGLLGFIVGFLLSFVYFIWYMLRVGKVNDDEYVRDIYQIKLLGNLDLHEDNF